MSPHDEARLIAAARKGDSRAFAALVDAHQQAVRGFLRRFAGHWADADDLAQEAFVTAWRKLSRFEGRSSFRSWVSGIGFRIARDAKRAHGRAQVRDSDWQNEQDAAEEGAPLEDRIAGAARDGGNCRTSSAPWLRCVLGEGFSHSEAAEILKLPLGHGEIACDAWARAPAARVLEPTDG